jgi:hypothetical protein
MKQRVRSEVASIAEEENEFGAVLPQEAGKVPTGVILLVPPGWTR